MSAIIEFNYQCGTDEKETRTTYFDTKDSSLADYVLTSGLVRAYSQSGADVTSTVIDSAYTTVSGNKVIWRNKLSPKGKYKIKVSGTFSSPNGDVLVSTGYLTVKDA